MPLPTWISRLPRYMRRLRRPAYMGSLRRTSPLSDVWGFDRGTPVDRYYIEAFLEAQRASITGRVLEIKSSNYSKRFGRGVTHYEVLDIDHSNPEATLIADLAAADHIADNIFDCFILTQTLQLIPEPSAALQQSWRMLRPGGTLLLTVPCISRIIPRYGLEQDYWRFTAASCRMLLSKSFKADQIEIHTYGNVLSAVAFLSGMACEELKAAELQKHDAYFPLIMAARATKG